MESGRNGSVLLNWQKLHRGPYANFQEVLAAAVVSVCQYFAWVVMPDVV